jgi:hypothetical protein
VADDVERVLADVDVPITAISALTDVGTGVLL